jgi:hypothetical protein
MVGGIIWIRDELPPGFAAGAILPPALHAIGRFRPCLRPLVADRLRLAPRLSPQSETPGACRAETSPTAPSGYFFVEGQGPEALGGFKDALPA